jgi:hypothetical protein
LLFQRRKDTDRADQRLQMQQSERNEGRHRREDEAIEQSQAIGNKKDQDQDITNGY